MMMGGYVMLLATELSRFETRRLSKIQNGRHKQRSDQHTLARQKNRQKKVHIYRYRYSVHTDPRIPPIFSFSQLIHQRPDNYDKPEDTGTSLSPDPDSLNPDPAFQVNPDPQMEINRICNN
jgi:hypothetical protein